MIAEPDLAGIFTHSYLRKIGFDNVVRPDSFSFHS